MQPEGLIFDCDGTVVDTMPIHYAAWCSTTAKHGLEFPEDRFYALGGVSPFEVLRMLSEEQGVEIDAEPKHGGTSGDMDSSRPRRRRLHDPRRQARQQQVVDLVLHVLFRF